MMSRTLVIAALLLTLVQVAPAEEPISFCARLTAVPVDGSSAVGQRAEFSAREITDLELRFLLTGRVSGDHTLEVKLTTPNGHHYQTLTAPVTTDSARWGTLKEVPTYPRPLPVQQLTPVTRAGGTAYETSLSFPVGGTAIVTSSLYGMWRVEVLLDGVPASCEILNVFWLQE